MNRGATAWVAEGASRRGSSHERTGAPNQDSYAVQRVGASVVAAVADGHGGRRYVRSQVGSSLAVRLATEIGVELLSTRRPDASAAARALPARLVPAWRAAVDDHYSQHPLTADEAAKAGEGLADPTILYGATLIVALATDDVVAVAQIGDGSALGAAAQRLEHLVPGDDRLVANETTSLCLPTALSDFRWGTAHFGSDSAILLSTDGYGNSFASEGWEGEVMSDLVDELGSHGFDEVAESLDSWAADSAAVGGDDVTLVLLARTSAGARRRKADWLTLGGLGVLAVAAATVVGLGSRGDATPPPETPVVATTTTVAGTPSSGTTTTTSSEPTVPAPNAPGKPVDVNKTPSATDPSSPSPSAKTGTTPEQVVGKNSPTGSTQPQGTAS